MKARVISGLLALLLLVYIYIFPGLPVYILIFLISALMFYEFLHVTNEKLTLGYYIICSLFTLMYYANLYLTIGLSIIPKEYLYTLNILLTVFFALTILVASMFYKIKTFKEVTYTIFGYIYTVILLSFIVLILQMEKGGFLFVYVWLGALGCDLWAFLIGRSFGKTKIIKDVSPNKTVEGSIGGAIGSIVMITLYTVIINRFFNAQIPWYVLIALYIPCGLFSQFGDWCASYIKRQFNVKDFGKIMPGHGGALDRLDSILFILPSVYVVFMLTGMK
ncbi:MAG TPA: phosphatidate cytidylyltransferase [Clostridia bacterium]|nr:MAG: Phosphatidate cytidylyltransferase [Firmicutes bacterium ADurb.Bin146]HOD92745.1 phosphatidate cytidylyltransferase [Clostridia bacterium]